jgi:hypothetical protein
MCVYTYVYLSIYVCVPLYINNKYIRTRALVSICVCSPRARWVSDSATASFCFACGFQNFKYSNN